MSYRVLSRVVRAALNLSGTPYPIRFRDGFARPKLVGRSYHWTTPGGRPVYHPSAYRRAFGRPVYHGSTLEIVVGAGWALRAALKA